MRMFRPLVNAVMTPRIRANREPQFISELVALAPGEPRSSAVILAAAETLLEDLAEFVEEACNGPFGDDGEPI